MATRKHIIVLDTSILPKRPSVLDIKKFLDNELKLDMSTVRSVQPHNVKNVVFLAMQSELFASKIAEEHHLKHFMECDGKKTAIPLPIYIESNAVDVRIHDLPEEIDNNTIANHMRQYGEVIGIRNEVWRSYFPGLSNGVRVVRMQVKHPIPSYITIGHEITMVTHHLQIRTCLNCGGKSHPKLRCSEIATKLQKRTTTSQPTTQQHLPSTSQQQQTPITLNDEQWPSLSKPAAVGNNEPKQKDDRTEVKRQRSLDSDTNEQTTKKTALSPASESNSSVMVISNGSPRGPPPPARIGRRLSYSWIEDAELRKEYLEEQDRRIWELIDQGL